MGFYVVDSLDGPQGIPLYNPEISDALLNSLVLNIEEDLVGSATAEGVTETNDSSTRTTESIELRKNDPYSRRSYLLDISSSQGIRIGQNCSFTRLSCALTSVNNLDCEQSLQHDLYGPIENSFNFRRN